MDEFFDHTGLLHELNRNHERSLIVVPARVQYGSMVTARSEDEDPVLNTCDHRYKFSCQLTQIQGN
jgi:hypothetical protein